MILAREEKATATFTTTITTTPFTATTTAVEKVKVPSTGNPELLEVLAVLRLE